MVKSSFQSHVSINIHYLFVLLNCRQLRNIKKAKLLKKLDLKIYLFHIKSGRTKKEIEWFSYEYFKASLHEFIRSKKSEIKRR